MNHVIGSFSSLSFALLWSIRQLSSLSFPLLWSYRQVPSIPSPLPWNRGWLTYACPSCATVAAFSARCTKGYWLCCTCIEQRAVPCVAITGCSTGL